MRNLSLKRASIAALTAWIMGVSAYVGSFFVPLMEDAEAQANLVLSLALVPAAALGARLYFRKERKTNGLLVGSFMFLVTILLDAVITVPVFIMPYGGNHISFFGDPGFWIIGLEYITVVTLYWLIKVRPAKLNQATA